MVLGYRNATPGNKLQKLSTQYFCQIDIHITQSIVTCIIEIQIRSRNINPLTVKKDSIKFQNFQYYQRDPK